MSKSYTIKILTPGPIKCMGMIHGPIITPYTVDREKVMSLLNEGLDVVQVNDDKTETKLTVDKVVSDFSGHKTVEPKVEKKAVESAPTEVAETVTEPSEPILVEPEAIVENSYKTNTYTSKKKKK